MIRAINRLVRTDHLSVRRGRGGGIWLARDPEKRGTRRLLAVLFLVACIFTAAAEDDAFERPPIAYSSSAPHDAVTVLKAKMASGELRLEGDEKTVVRAVLSTLGVAETSQMLVFSKTSFQKDRISPLRPRAVYFSDDVYVGWCPGGLLEIAAIDPVLGPVFYSFDPRTADKTKRFERDADCLRCHGGTFIRDIPGLLARSVFTDQQGQLLLALGLELVDAATPIEKRWGGWYVTARRSGGRHRGNLVLSTEQEPTPDELAVRANLQSLDSLVDTSPYLLPSSDVVSLLVFEHQVSVQNVLTRANQQCLRMMAYQKNLQKELKEPVSEEPSYESVRHSFSESTRQVLDALLCKDDAPLPEGGIEGVGGFARNFVARPKAGGDQASLKQLELRTRLFKYRCSYLIQSAQFDQLQPTLRRRILQRLWRVLTEPEGEPRYAYLEPEERAGIRHILASGLAALPANWRAAR